MNQTHSNKVVTINENNKNIKRINADALITEIKNIFDLPVVGTETLFEFGEDRNYSKYPYDASKGSNGIDPPIWDKINDNLTTLCQYLYVYYNVIYKKKVQSFLIEPSLLWLGNFL